MERGRRGAREKYKGEGHNHRTAKREDCAEYTGRYSDQGR